MSSASQGPGWWQASDGNWYPPQQQPGYQAPPPPAPQPGPQSWSAPSAYPQYPAPGGRSFGNAQGTFTAGLSRLPLAARLFFGGFVLALVSLFLPFVTVSGEGVSVSVSMWKAGGGVAYFLVLMLAACAVLSVTTLNRPQSERATLIGLSVVIGLLAIHLIYNWATYNSQIAEAKADDSSLANLNASPAFGIFVYTAAICFLAVRIVMIWIDRSKAQPRAY